MDIVRIRNGLGNQMFEYAFYLELKSRGRDVKLDLSFFEKYPDFVNPYELTNVFKNIKFEPIENGYFEQEWSKFLELKKDENFMKEYIEHPENRKYWGEDMKAYGKYDERVFWASDCIYVGVWMSEKYFSHVKDEVRKQFEFSYGEEKLQKLAKRIQEEKIVCIQIRTANQYYEEMTPNGYLPFNILKSGYYNTAVEYVESILGKDIKFFVISDDIERAKKELAFIDAEYMDKNLFEKYEDWYDMYLISVCQCSILANSSFSWWGAWLNQREDKKIIVPKKFHVTWEMQDAYPDEWIKL